MEAEGLELGNVAEGHRLAFGRLRSTDFAAVILDYDGTIVSTDDRYSMPGEDVIGQINRILEGGVTIGIATGRGGSVGEALRQVIPDQLQNRVLVGYYNGGYVQPLNVDISQYPPPRSVVIDEIVSWLRDGGDYPTNTRASPLQISITMSDVGDIQRLEQRISAYPGFSSERVRVVRSKHSIDIGLETNTKLNVRRAIAQNLGKPDIKALCIGDSGHIGGNDFELLGEGGGVSVDSVCHRLEGAGRSLATNSEVRRRLS